MALSTFAELQASIAGWLIDRDDLTARILDFITLAEERANRDLRTRHQVTVATLVPVTGTRAVALPSGYLESQALTLNSNPKKSLQFLSIPTFTANYISSTNGSPEAFTVVGTNLWLGPTPEDATTLELVYYAAVAALSTTATTNWLLTNYPSVYLYGALLEAAPYLGEDPRTDVWGQMFDRAVGKVQSSDERARWSGGSLQIRADVSV